MRSRLFASLLSLAFALLAPAAHANTPFQGLWCGNGLLKDYSLHLSPGGQGGEIAAVLARKGRKREIQGHVDDGLLRSQATKYGSLVLSAIANELRIVDGEGTAAILRGFSFRRAGEQGCGA